MKDSDEFVKCRWCPQTFDISRVSWIDLLTHVRNHYEEIRFERERIEADYPTQETMNQTMHKWYEEVKA